MVNSVIKKTKDYIRKNTFIFNCFKYFKYFIVRFIIKRRFKQVGVNKKIKYKIIDDNYLNTFFGYYNLPPWNKNGKLLCCGASSNQNRPSRHNEKLDILLYKIESKTHEVITNSKAWNWQQGCLLRWLGDSNNKIIYNDFDEINNRYISKIYDLKNNRFQELSMPIYDVASNGKFAITLNFSRLSKYRPDYGYFNKDYQNLSSDSDDGIWFLDLESNTSKLIISLDDLKNYNYDDTMEEAVHLVNHIDISPDNKRFMFLHRWITKNGRYHRLVTSDHDGNNIFILTGNKLVSHCIWKDSKSILAYSYQPEYGNRYFLYQDLSGNWKPVAEESLINDGHPSFSPSGEWLITDDASPDRSRFKSLYLFDYKNKVKVDLAHFYHRNVKTPEIRCDLHPKWDKTGRYISIDAPFSNLRKMLIIDLNNLIK